MEQSTFIGMLVLSLGSLIGIIKFIVDGIEKRNGVTNSIRLEQIEATHKQTIATNDLTNEMRIMRKDISDIELRTHNLEVVVYKKDRKATP